MFVVLIFVAWLCSCLMDFGLLGRAAANILNAERQVCAFHSNKCKLTTRVQIASPYYGMAGDLDTVKYTYPVPVQISHDAYRSYLDVVDATACARIRNAMVHADVPGAVELRSRFRIGVLYSELLSLLVFYLLVSFLVLCSFAAPLEFYRFLMEGLVQLRRRHRCIWPPLHLWDWAFEHGSLWCEELVPFIEGDEIPATRTFHPQALPSYPPVDPGVVRRQKAAAAAAEKKRQASIVPPAPLSNPNTFAQQTSWTRG